MCAGASRGYAPRLKRHRQWHNVLLVKLVVSLTCALGFRTVRLPINFFGTYQEPDKISFPGFKLVSKIMMLIVKWVAVAPFELKLSPNGSYGRPASF